MPKQKVYEIWLGALQRDDQEKVADLGSRFIVAFAHSVFCKYSKNNFPSTSVEKDRFGQVSYHRIGDAFISNYIDKATSSVRRWIKYSRLVRADIKFLNRKGEPALKYSIYVYRTSTGPILRKTHQITRLLDETEADLSGILRELEHSEPWKVDPGELHEFKLAFKFTEPLTVKHRPGEHRWREVKQDNVATANALIDSVAHIPPRLSEVFNVDISTERFLQKR
ncbi:hypothetical protein FO519_000481 [Halicephalobus sp. NKZ332]|nr:hypothetical protein FO519_000481 [Halicephalobus sp. NKZ332]